MPCLASCLVSVCPPCLPKDPTSSCLAQASPRQCRPALLLTCQLTLPGARVNGNPSARIPLTRHCAQLPSGLLINKRYQKPSRLQGEPTGRPLPPPTESHQFSLSPSPSAMAWHGSVRCGGLGVRTLRLLTSCLTLLRRAIEGFMGPSTIARVHQSGELR